MAALRHKSRDNARTPMQWDASPNAGFTTGEPWLAVNPNYPEINAAAQVDDPDSVFAHYQRLIAFRHGEPAVVHGDFTLLLPEHEELYVFTRAYGGTDLLVVANLSSVDGVVAPGDWSAWAGAEHVLGNCPGVTTPVDAPLLPWEARVYRRSA
jgi:oligo-1,6-glucosidase